MPTLRNHLGTTDQLSPASECARKVLQIMLHGLCGVPERSPRLNGSISFLIILFCCFPAASFTSFTNRVAEMKHVKTAEMQREVATLRT